MTHACLCVCEFVCVRACVCEGQIREHVAHAQHIKSKNKRAASQQLMLQPPFWSTPPPDPPPPPPPLPPLPPPHPPLLFLIRHSNDAIKVLKRTVCGSECEHKLHEGDIIMAVDGVRATGASRVYGLGLGARDRGFGARGWGPQ